MLPPAVLSVLSPPLNFILLVSACDPVPSCVITTVNLLPATAFAIVFIVIPPVAVKL